VPVPSDLTWIDGEELALADLVEDRTRGFVGRATALEQLERTRDSPASEANPFGVCVLGGPGAGKSAVLGEVWKRDRPESTVTLMHAVDASTQGPSIGPMLLRFVAELAVHPDAKHWFRFTDTGQIWNRQVIEAAYAPDATDEQLYTAFGQMLSWAAAVRRVVGS
jgi:hypothetical protein